MSVRLSQRLRRELAAGRRLFVPFITAGDRGLDFTHRAVLALADAGADAVELGVPFSDPIADGRVIQKSSERALRRGTNLPGILAMIARLRRTTEVPILLMGYLNPFLRPGLVHTARAAARAGVDGFIIPDLPPEEAERSGWLAACRQHGLATVFLAAPTSTNARIGAVARASSGYIYYVSITGTTGMRATLPPGLSAGVARIRARSRLPVLVGFGVSTPLQARAITKISDGVIVGSALVKTMETGKSNRSALNALSRLARKLAHAVKNP